MTLCQIRGLTTQHELVGFICYGYLFGTPFFAKWPSCWEPFEICQAVTLYILASSINRISAIIGCYNLTQDFFFLDVTLLLSRVGLLPKPNCFVKKKSIKKTDVFHESKNTKNSTFAKTLHTLKRIFNARAFWIVTNIQQMWW